MFGEDKTSFYHPPSSLGCESNCSGCGQTGTSGGLSYLGRSSTGPSAASQRSLVGTEEEPPPFYNDNSHDVALKLVIVGDLQIGKSAMVKKFVCDEPFNEVYTPTNFELVQTVKRIEKINQKILFNIWDTSGSPAHDSVRPLAYADANVFLICFDISDPKTLDHVVTKWYREIGTHSESPIIILCGCRSDLRSNVECLSTLASLKQIPVTSEQALQVSRFIEAANYVETSAVIPGSQSIQDAFEIAALAAFGKLNGLSYLGGKISPFRSKNGGKSNKTLANASPTNWKSRKDHSKCLIT